ncbi:MAG: transcriptional regulator [Thermoplasmatota archaeon]
MKKELLEDTRGLLARAGFYLSEVCTIRPSSFDFVARRDNALLLVKVLNNIDALSEEVARELLFLAKHLDGIPLLIGNRTGTGPLEDEVVYYRYNVPIITLDTLHDYLNGVHPLICAAPGGFYVRLNGERLRELRNEQDVSRGQLARMTGVSRRTIRMYEQGERATIEMAEKMAELLGEDVLQPLDLAAFIHEYEMDTQRHISDCMLSLLEAMNISIMPTDRSPFNAISQFMDELLLVATECRRVRERAQLLSNVSRVVERPSVLFMESSARTNIAGIPVIGRKELSTLDDPLGLLRLIRERE